MAYKKFEEIKPGDSLFFLNPHNSKVDHFTVKDIAVFKTFVSIQYYVHNKVISLKDERGTLELLIRGRDKSMVLVPKFATLFSTSDKEILEWLNNQKT